MSVSFPALAARTARFTLGLPRNISVSDDGTTVIFVRTLDGTSRVGQLWLFDVESGSESLLVDPARLIDGDEELSDEEKSRRERSRESAAGVVSYDLNSASGRLCFALSGQLWVTDLSTQHTRQIETAGSAVIDPQFDPTGRHIAYASDGALRIVGADGSGDRAVVEPDGPSISWGQADFLAAEEMDRFTGYWWSPDGEALLVQRTDDAVVQQWYISDPANPAVQSQPQRYPAAGTANPHVSLWRITLAGQQTQIDYDTGEFEYLARVSWNEYGTALLQVLTRDQRRSQVLAIDATTGETSVVRELTDPAWVELASAPRWTSDGRLLTVEDADGWRRVALNGDPISPQQFQVRSIIEAYDDSVIVSASTEPTEIQIVRIGFDGLVEPITDGQALHSAVIGGPVSGGPASSRSTIVITRSGLDTVETSVVVHHGGRVQHISSVAAKPDFHPAPQLVKLGQRELRAAVLLPREHRRGSAKLPLLMHPYGGPHAQRVLASSRAFFEPQWLADQGFCVVVADGRGTPGRGHRWEREIKDSFAAVTLADQVDAVEAVSELYPDDVDPSRVAIAGWSYGGYLAALAVLQRPDVFHAAIAGAPVTDWRLYDTCYTERYLGDPNVQPRVYDDNSLIAMAPNLQRPLMLIHGLADDNVVAAHSLRLSSALLAAGRPHTVLPLSGVTHMASAEHVAENLQLLQVEFFKQHLAN